jgi:dipeptidyl aminopeptidase/acylaminoacyl peptidase
MAEAGVPPEDRAGRRLLRPDDVFAVRWLGDTAVSPDGGHVAWVERRVDERADAIRSRVLLADLEAGTTRALSPADATDSSPRFLADGSGLAFRAGRGLEGSGPRIAPLAGGAGLPWLGVPAGAGAFSVAPDGSAIVVSVAADDAPPPDAPLWEVTGPGWQQDALPTVERRTRSNQWRIDRSGAALPLTSPDAGIYDGAPSWSPDGRWILFASDRPAPTGSPHAGPPPSHPMARPTRLWLVPAWDAVPAEPLTPPAAVSAVTWSPDGRSIAWLGNTEPVAPGVAARLWITDVPGGATREVPLDVPAPGAAVRSDDPRGMGDATLTWTADGRIWSRWADGGASRLGWVDPATGALARVVEGELAVLAFDVSQDGRTLAHVTATADHPGEVAFVGTGPGGPARTLTDANAWLREVELGRTRRFTATGPDRLPLEGWVIEPPAEARRDAGTAPAPAVLSVHGGPHYPIGWRFSFESHRLAARGYAVVNGNARGSTGYGDHHATAIHRDWGGKDLGDTLAILDAAIATSAGPAAAPGAMPLDPDRVAITGVSYGGYLTIWAIGQRRDRFRAAIAENPISNLASAFGAADSDGGFWIDELGGAPWEHPAMYAARSPLTHAARVRTPLLLLHAEEDHNCPVGQSEELYSALTRLGRPVRFLRARGLGHLMNFTGGGRFRLARAAAVDDWLDRWLRPPGTTGQTYPSDHGGDR